MATTTPKPDTPAADPAKPEAAAAPKANNKTAPFYALHTIDGGDEYGGASPGSIVRAASAQQRDELFTLEAARELTDAEAALAEKTAIRTLGEKPEDLVG